MEFNITDDVILPATNLADAYNSAVKQFFCFATPFVVPRLVTTPQGAIVAGVWSLLALTQCGTSPGTVPRRPFQGGQCPGVPYSFPVQFQNKDGAPFPPTVARGIGPVVEIFQQSKTGGIGMLGYRQSVGGPILELSTDTSYGTGGQPWTLISIGAASRDDGLPDTCGDPLPVTPILPPPAPAPPYPPIEYPAPDRPVYVDFQLPDLSVIAFPVWIGPFNLDASFQFPITLQINGTTFNIGQDGSAESTGEIDITEVIDTLNEILDLIVEQGYSSFDRALLQYVYDQHFEPRAVQLTSGVCGDEPSVIEVTGNGFGLLDQVLTLESAGRYAQANSLCPPVPPDPVAEELIFAASIIGDNTELFSGPVSPDVRSIRIRILSYDPNLVPQSRAFPGGDYRKFGNLSFTLEDIEGPGEYVYVQDVDQYLPLPLRGVDGKIRVQCKRSVSFEIYDTGDRY